MELTNETSFVLISDVSSCLISLEVTAPVCEAFAWHKIE